MSREISEKCEDCGLEVPGGMAGCLAIFEGFLARDFSDPAYFRTHRMLVDTYSLQHPGRYCKSSKSLAAHLTGLCSLLENEGSKALGNEFLRRWLDGKVSLEKPEIPAIRGSLTIGDLRNAKSQAEYSIAMDAWSRSTWSAYETLHVVARKWIEQAQGGKNGRH